MKHNIQTVGLETFADQMKAINNPLGEELTWDKAKDILPKLLFNFKKDTYKKQLCSTAANYKKMKLDYRLEDKCAVMMKPSLREMKGGCQQ